MKKLRENINTGYGEEKTMGGKIVLILLCMTAFCIIPAAALEIAEGPVLIHETDLPVHALTTDGRYLVISGDWKNNTLETYHHKEGFTFDGLLLLYDSRTGTLEKIPGNVPPDYYGAAISDGVLLWTSAPYQFPTNNGNMRQEKAAFQYTVGEKWPEYAGSPQGRLDGGDNGTFLIITGESNRPELKKMFVYDAAARTAEQIPAQNPPAIGKITGDTVVWSENGNTGDGKIRVYNRSTHETTTIGEDGTYHGLFDATENTVLHLQSQSKKYNEGPFELRATSLTTGETHIITDHQVINAKIDPPIVIWTEKHQNGDDRTYPLYAASLTEAGDPVLISPDAGGAAEVLGNLVVWSEWNDTTGITSIRMIRLNIPDMVPEIAASVPQTLMPETTESGMPPQFIIGTIAFVLACLLAVLWRK